MKRIKPLQERFWAKVTKAGPDDCWKWTASTNKKGYGQISAGCRGLRPLALHRVSWEMHCGPIPGGLFVLHSCDNPPCVNPKHLFLGTDEDNKEDMLRKDRLCRGDRHRNSKTNAAEVAAIRKLHAAGMSEAELVHRFKRTKGIIHHVVTGSTWKKELQQQAGELILESRFAEL